MPQDQSEPLEISVDLGAALGAEKLVSVQRFAIYVPDKDKEGKDIKDFTEWKRRAMLLLGRLNGGATAFPPCEGLWMGESGSPIFENTTIVYSYIDPEKFYDGLLLIRAFLHEFGRTANQDAVYVEFDGFTYRIKKYDE